jgi:hypothetical protein
MTILKIHCLPPLSTMGVVNFKLYHWHLQCLLALGTINAIIHFIKSSHKEKLFYSYIYIKGVSKFAKYYN